MFILPHKQKFIHNHFFEFSFKGSSPDVQQFKKLNSADQYYLAEIYNWDDGADVLHWIIDSPRCDKGTASMIFWRSEPDFYLEHTSISIPSYEAEVFDLVHKIVRKFEQNEFTRSRFKYDPHERLRHFPAGLTIPDELRHPTKGIRPLSLGPVAGVIFDWLQERKKR